MKRLFFFLLFVCTHLFCVAQYHALFQSAYVQHPAIPIGVLEAVSWGNTRMVHLLETQQESCSGMPKYLGIMGLCADGKNYFRENALLVEQLSGVTVSQQLSNPQNQIMAYAIAFDTLFQYYHSILEHEARAIYRTLEDLSEIPDSGVVNFYALDAQIFQVLRFMNDVNFASENQFTAKNYALKHVFGTDNYKVLNATKVVFTADNIQNEQGDAFILSAEKTSEYDPALWNPAPSCNYNSRGGTPISAFTVHTTQGSYAGSISWSQNCSSNVSFHYIIRSSDGQVTQMVLEANRAWHVGSENSYTIGCEHEGFVDNPTWYTEAMYNSSADLTRDVVNSGYGMSPLRTFYGAATTGLNTLGGCTKIKGHQHFPNQSHTDPGIHWNWEKYYKLINNVPSITTITTPNGILYDSGGPSGNYGNDQRLLWLIQPTGASSVSISFAHFDLENNWDFLFIYDGATTNASLIGKYTGNNLPPAFTSSSGSVLIEFRSDCATTATGWAMNYSASSSPLPPPPITEPQTSILAGSTWKTANFTATISDISTQSTIQERYFLVADRPSASSNWKTQNDQGFAYDNFDELGDWVQQTGVFSIAANRLVNNNDDIANTNVYLPITQSNANDFLYEWTQKFTGSGANQRAGLHFMCSNATLPNRGDSYFVFLREGNNKVQIYSVTNDVFTLRTDDDFTVNNHVDYQIRVTFSPISGWIRVYIDGNLVSSWQDANPLQSGNSISFRTANAHIEFDDLRVYKSRAGNVNVSMNSGGLLRYESLGGVPSGRLVALSRDMAAWSPVVFSDFLVDWSVPILGWVNDGTSTDIDEFSGTSISGNWSFSDPHSGISNYQYAVGTTPNGNDVVGWTNAGLTNGFTELINGVIDQIYYVSVRATNGAGLVEQATSNGQIYKNNALPPPPLPSCFISGGNAVCQGDTIVLIPSEIGGFWTTSNALIATVDNGIVIGVGQGSAIISYGGSTSCSGTATFDVNVNNCSPPPLPPPPITEPQTSILAGSTWKIANFTATISDISTQSTIQERYFLVADRPSASSNWKTQNDQGFAYDNFDELGDWVQQTGVFSIAANRLVNNNDDIANTNVYLPITQSNANDFLYEWTQKFNGSGANQRAGLHFMCSNATLPNRGDSYFVFLREGNNKVQIYSVTNDVFTLRTDDDFTVNNHVDYQIRVSFSPISGWIRVYIDGNLVSSWQDANPLQSGNSISFRTANAHIEFDDLRVYKSRAGNVNVSMNSGGLLRYESLGGVPSGRLVALSRDMDAWSPVVFSDFLVDWSVPILGWVNDGTSTDIDEFSGTSISGNWSFSDPHSGISNYQYAVGTTPNGNDVVGWTNAGLTNGFTELINGVIDQIYYVSVRATNGAGLVEQATSNGQKYDSISSPPPLPPPPPPDKEPEKELTIDEIEKTSTIFVFPNPFDDKIVVKNLKENAKLTLYDTNGKIVWRKNIKSSEVMISTESMSRGVYQLFIVDEHQITNYKLVKVH